MHLTWRRDVLGFLLVLDSGCLPVLVLGLLQLAHLRRWLWESELLLLLRLLLFHWRG